MKRTPENGGEKRNLVFRFRVTADEKIKLQQLAKEYGMTVSDIVRTRLGGKDRSADRKTFIRLLAEIGKQGSNLNQIAKAMNVWMKTGNDPKIDALTVRNCLMEINRLTKELLEIIKYGHRRKNQG